MKVLIIPDIHLGAKSFGKDYSDNLNSRIQDQLHLMDYILDIGVSNKVDKVILLGDVFHKEQPEPILISLFFSWLSKLTDHFSVDIIYGNHDIKRSGKDIVSILDCIPAARIKNCQIHKQIESIVYDDLSICYIPYFDMRQIANTNSEALNIIKTTIQSQQKTKLNIAVGHLAIEHSIYVGNEITDENNEIFLPIDTFEKFDYTWMGHIHNYQILSKKPFVSHVGSLDKYSFSEKDKYIILYDSKENNYNSIKLPTRNLIEVQLSIPKEIENVVDYVKNQIASNQEQFKDSIVRIKLELSSNDIVINKKEISDIFQSLNVQNVAEFIETKVITNIAPIQNIDETTDKNKAIETFILEKFKNESDDFKTKLMSLCKSIAKEFDK